MNKVNRAIAAAPVTCGIASVPSDALAQHHRQGRWTPGGGVTLALDRSGYTGSAPFEGREPGSNGLTFDAAGATRHRAARQPAHRAPRARRSLYGAGGSLRGQTPQQPQRSGLSIDRRRPVWMAYSVRDDGTLAAGRQFAGASHWVRDGDGLPDGLKVDARGHVLATGPGAIHVFAAGGTRLGRIQTGVPTGNVNWGEDGTVLFITANHWICRLRTKGRS